MGLRRLAAASAVALVTTAALAGCGGDAEPRAGASASAPSSTDSDGAAFDDPFPPVPTNTLLQQPKAGATIKPQATLTAVPGASQLPAGEGAPRTIQGFPVPPGAKVKDPGPLDETWQFDIRAGDPDDVLAFYERVLPQMGYTVRTDVTYTLGNEDVHWDLVFDGKVSGSMVRDPEYDLVFVVVNPPGQPAIAGEE
ncbi:MAG TPA: hypothetical protein VGE14_00610 [Marmoricola sp.]